MSDFFPLHIRILVISDSRDRSNDRSGALLETKLEHLGHVIRGIDFVRDEVRDIRAHLNHAVFDPDIDVWISTGGTGLRARDVTPEALEALITKPIPGFGELFRMLSYQEIGSSTIQSRALAGMVRETLAIALPGSPGACRLACQSILSEQLDLRHRPCNLAELLPRVQAHSVSS